jgi:hypothetical protein
MMGGANDYNTTLGHLHISYVLPLVHRYEPFVPQSSAAYRYTVRIKEGKREYGRYLTSTTRLSFPTREDILFSLSNENFASGKRYDVTITYKAKIRGRSGGHFSYCELC